MNRLIKPILALTTALFITLLTACSGLQVDSANTTDEPLVIEDYLAGESSAYGVLFSRSGAAKRHFNVELFGTWDEEKQQLTLVEDFIFDDGEVSQRTWFITKTAEDEYIGEASDVEGIATGKAKGNTLLWRYTLNIPYKGRNLAVDLEDWMFLSDDVLVNRATMRKFGFKVGELVLTFDKKTTTPDGKS